MYDTVQTAIAAAVMSLFVMANCSAPTRSGSTPPATDGPLAHAGALAYLPERTVAVAIFRRPDAAPPQIAEAIWRIALPETRSLITDELSPDHPIGLALLDVPSRTVVGFATVRDRARMVSALIANDPTLAHTTAGSGEIFSAPERGYGVVLRDDHAFVVQSGVASKRDAAEVYLASADRARSLSGLSEFVDAAAGLRSGRERAGYVALPIVAEHVIARADDLEYAALVRADEFKRRVDEAQTHGASKDDIAALSAALRVQAAAYQRARRHARGTNRLARELIASWSGLGIGGHVRGNSVAIELRATPARDSLAAHLLDASSGRPAWLSALGPGWQIRCAASTRPDALMRAFEIFVDAWASVDMATLDAALKQHVGVDFARDVTPLLSGQLGVALGAPRDPGAGNAQQGDDFEMIVGVQDNARALALIERLASALDLTHVTGVEAPAFELPIGDVRVFVGVAADAVVVSTDRAAVRRLATPPTGKPALWADRAAAILDVDSRVWLELLARDDKRPEPPVFVLFDDDVLRSNLDVPFSSEYTTLAGKLRHTHERYQTLVSNAHSGPYLASVAHLFGRLQLAFTPVATGPQVSATGRVDVRKRDVNAALAAARQIHMQHERARANERATIDQLYNRLEVLKNQLLRIRARDVQAWDRRQQAP